jgi:hypothetical protein
VVPEKLKPKDLLTFRWLILDRLTRNRQRGHIEGVVFRNIRAVADPLRVELKGFDSAHAVENVRFQDVMVNGELLSAPAVKTNDFVKNVTWGR